MRKLNTMGLAFFILFSMVSVGYSACEGDLTCNGTVDGSDLAIFAADFGTTGCGDCDDVIARIQDLEDRVTQLEALLQNVTRIGDNIMFEAVNVQIVNGTGTTAGYPNSLGNLIVGYNEIRPVGNVRDGSHNIILGTRNNYSSFGGIVGGYWNTISGQYASIVGGDGNTASGDYSSVSGGQLNQTSGLYSSVSGGRYNKASGEYSFVGGGGGSNSNFGNEAFSNYSAILGGRSNIAGDNSYPVNHSVGEQATVCGGFYNTASGQYSSVSGGYGNIANRYYSSVSGGALNTASGNYSNVSGGRENTAIGYTASVSGGRYNKASGEYSFVGGGGGSDSNFGNEAFSHYSAILGGSSNIAGDNSNPDDHSIGQKATVSGGVENTASGDYSSVSGGSDNSASGVAASVSGGYENTASGNYSTISGGYENEAWSVHDSVSGGYRNTAKGGSSSVSGGYINTASGNFSSVSGGANRSVPDINDWRAGSLFEDY
jgi:hypothetical protein